MRVHSKLGRRRKFGQTASAEVELNVAAMLDMAFQLLAFFILTFNPSDVETQITMFMPAKKSVMQSSGASDSNQTSELESFGFPLSIQVSGNADGVLTAISIGDQLIKNDDPNNLVITFDNELKRVLQVPGFEGVDLTVDASLNYDWMIKIVDTVTKQKLPNNEYMNKINIQQSR
jgi:biopolymer transport protein ExbD